MQIFAQSGRVIVRHLAEELIYTILHKIQYHLCLAHLVHDLMRHVVVEMVVYVDDCNLLLLNELIDLE